MSHHDESLAAPTELTAAIVAGGVHLTWRDNSTAEDEFMVLRKDAASAWIAVGSSAANASSFHDTSVVRGTTYRYVVHAMRANTTSMPSNEILVAVP